MVLNWLKNKVSPIAADIGTESIKLLQVERREEQAFMLAAADAYIPEEIRAKHKERDEYVVETVKKLLHNGNFKGNKVVTCLPASQMAVQHLRVGKMSEEELKKALPYEAAGKFPFDASRAVLRHVVAGEVYQDQETRTEVIVMAASRESVERHLAILDKSKLEVAGIHTEPTALIECFAHLFRRKGDENICTMFVDIGAGATHVVIAHGRQMVFAKQAPVGGDVFTRRVTDVLKNSFVAARDLRIKIARTGPAARMPAGVLAINAGANGSALGDTGGIPDAAIDNDTHEKVVAAMELPLDDLVGELEMCVRYYESIFPSQPIHRVIFVGGEARHVWMCQKTAQRLNLPATLGDPLARLAKDDKSKTEVDMRQPQPGWAIAVGLALGAGMTE